MEFSEKSMEKLWICSIIAACTLSHMCCAAGVQGTSDSCNQPCGHLAICSNSNCTCPADLVPHKNGKDCRNASCTSPDCLSCETADRCTWCVSFISMSTGLCLQKCEGSAEKVGDNLVCTESKESGVNIVVAVVSGVAAGTVICIIVIVATCVYIRKTRRNINLQNKYYSSRQMESGHMKQFPVYENNASETDGPTAYRSSKIDPLEYASELDKLRPHADTLMELLSQVRSKTRAMDASDARVPTYKGVIHQLCRVLQLIHKKDPVVSIPSDALGLIQWAHQMLDDHREQQNSSGGGSADFPIAQISSVDFDFDNPTNPVYALPEKGSSVESSQFLATPYSTVPVPLSQAEQQQQQQHYGTGKKPGFATISRGRYKPDSDLIRALEAEFSNTDTVSAIQDPTSVPQNSGFRRTDLQNFLIHNGEKSEVRNTIGYNVQNSTVTSEPQVIIDNQKNLSDQTFNSELNEKLKDIGNKFQHNNLTLINPINSQSAQPSSVSKLHQPDHQQTSKKNIITNPNAHKKGNSLGNKSSKYAVPNIGYFANGRYYDPNPMPCPDPEVYAPGSTYSDHSNAMSTFLGDVPRSRSVSSSDHSGASDGDSENSGGDLDVFPFDPKDCTDPVEV